MVVEIGGVEFICVGRVHGNLHCRGREGGGRVAKEEKRPHQRVLESGGASLIALKKKLKLKKFILC